MGGGCFWCGRLPPLPPDDCQESLRPNRRTGRPEDGTERVAGAEGMAIGALRRDVKCKMKTTYRTANRSKRQGPFSERIGQDKRGGWADPDDNNTRNNTKTTPQQHKTRRRTGKTKTVVRGSCLFFARLRWGEHAVFTFEKEGFRIYKREGLGLSGEIGRKRVSVSPGKVGFPNAGSGSRALPFRFPAFHTTRLSLSNNNKGNTGAGCGIRPFGNATYKSDIIRPDIRRESVVLSGLRAESDFAEWVDGYSSGEAVDPITVAHGCRRAAGSAFFRGGYPNGGR